MMVLGTNVMGCLNKTEHSREHVGAASWRVILGAGILAFVLGFFNVLASVVFRESAKGVTARQIRAKGAVALQQSGSVRKADLFVSSSSSVHKTPVVKPQSLWSFKVRGNNGGGSNLPSYHSTPRKSKRDSLRRSRTPINISGPLEINPQFKDLVIDAKKLEPAHHHPSNRQDPFMWRV